jgi:hypothetical protein
MKFLPLLLLLTSCNVYPSSYAIGITGFDEHRKTIVADAASRWQTAVGDHLHITLTRDCTTNDNGDICIQNVTVEKLTSIARSVGYVDNHDGLTQARRSSIVWPASAINPCGIVIYLAGDPPTDAELSQLTQHELGHAFGLGHSSGATVMNPGLGAAKNVTEADVKEYMRLR